MDSSVSPLPKGNVEEIYRSYVTEPLTIILTETEIAKYFAEAFKLKHIQQQIFSNKKPTVIQIEFISHPHRATAYLVRNLKLLNPSTEPTLHIYETKNASDILKSINILDAIGSIKCAWDNVKTQTIINCFSTCGLRNVTI